MRVAENLASCVRARGFYKDEANLGFCAWVKRKFYKLVLVDKKCAGRWLKIWVSLWEL